MFGRESADENCCENIVDNSDIRKLCVIRCIPMDEGSEGVLLRRRGRRDGGDSVIKPYNGLASYELKTKSTNGGNRLIK